jgi:hypothetical protein
VTARYDELREVGAGEILQGRVGLPWRAFAHQQPRAGEQLAGELRRGLVRRADAATERGQELQRLELVSPFVEKLAMSDLRVYQGVTRGNRARTPSARAPRPVDGRPHGARSPLHRSARPDARRRPAARRRAAPRPRSPRAQRRAGLEARTVGEAEGPLLGKGELLTPCPVGADDAAVNEHQRRPGAHARDLQVPYRERTR